MFTKRMSMAAGAILLVLVFTGVSVAQMAGNNGSQAQSSDPSQSQDQWSCPGYQNGMGMGMMNSQSADASESQDQWSCPGYRSGMAMGMGMMNMMPMMHNMMHNAYQNGMMNSDFSKLEENFNNMMKIDDLKELKSAMKEHYAMMQEYSEKINGQAGTCAYGNMMSMMESCGMHGVRQNEGSMHKGNMHNEEEDI